MCGISGFVSIKPNQFSLEQLKASTDVIAHRGPDADGFYYDSHVGLGHRRLSILDLSHAANQPMTSACGNYVIIYNGEVYNYKEIAQGLDVKLRTTSDTEVILEAFIKYGKDCVQLFNGMFAFAIYDKRKGELFICRDRMGIKPIFYFFDGKTFAFSSELKSLISLMPDKKTLNHQAIYRFLHLNYIPAPDTIYQEFKKFPSGHYATFSNGNLTIEPFWTLEEKINQETIQDEQTAKKQLKQLLEQSVAYRMISDVPFGTFLSGGIDSSTITAIAQSLSDVPVNTFSIAYENSKYDESAFSKEVAKKLGTSHHTLQLKEQDALDLFSKIFEAYDEPFGDASAISTMLVSKFAREKVTMTLSGDGGDELFMGYGFYKWRERLENPLVKSGKPFIKSILNLGNERMKRVAWLFENVQHHHLAGHIFSQESLNYSEHDLIKLLKNQRGSSPLAEQREAFRRALTPMERQAMFDLRYYIQDDLLVKVDRATMQFSLETRVPLLDYNIVEFALNLHESLKIKNGETKYLLKQVLYDYLPKEIFNRPKWGFGVPLNKWLRKELFYLQEKYLSKEITEKHGLLNYEALKIYQDKYNSGLDTFVGRVWLPIVLHAFLEKQHT
ncbi:MAG: asparagine synthase (glutamine-hydrolyzing) [Flavobacteriales bacterium]